MIVDTKHLAEFFGVTEKTINVWAREGMPALVLGEGGRGNKNEYDSKAVIDWYTSRLTSKPENENPRDRLDRLKGDEIEIKIAEKLQHLVLASDIESKYIEKNIRTRSEFLKIPLIIKEKVLLDHGVEIDYLEIKKIIEQILNEISKSDESEYDDNHESETQSDN